MPEAVCLLLQYSGKCQHSTLRRLLFDCVLTETKKNREKPAKKKFVRGKKDSSLFFFCLVSYAVVHKCHTDQQFLCVCAIALCVCVCVCVPLLLRSSSLFHIPVCPLRPSQSLTCFLCHLVIPSSLASFQPITHSSKGFVLERRSLTLNGTLSLSPSLSMCVSSWKLASTEPRKLPHWYI